MGKHVSESVEWQSTQEMEIERESERDFFPSRASQTDVG